jgi:DEAD/DEAH box helicase domain-containing protein
MCSTSDLGTECANPHETRGIPHRILLYDRHPGGIGIASQVSCPLMDVRLRMHYA